MKSFFAKRVLACGLSVVLSSAFIPMAAFADDPNTADTAQDEQASDAVNSIVSDGSGSASFDPAEYSDEFDQLFLAYFALQAVNESTQSALSANSAESDVDAQAAAASSREAAIPISGIEDFRNIANNLYGTYELTQDIDLTGYTHSNSCIVSGTFAGKLYGNGHTISGLYGYSLFETISGGTIEGVCFSKMTNAPADPDSSTRIGRSCILTTTSNGATFKDLKFEDATIAGHDYCGIVTGVDSNSTFEKITVEGRADIYRDGSESGLFAGILDGSTLCDIHVSGDLSTSGTRVGALAGRMNGGSARNVLVWANMRAEISGGGTLNSAFIGDMEGAVPRIHDCVILGEVSSNGAGTTYAFAPVADAMLSSVQDIRISDSLGADKIIDNGSSSLIGSTIKTFDYAADVQANDTTARGFYRGLGFSGSVWDYDSPASSFKIRHFFNPPCTISSAIDFANEKLEFTVSGNENDLQLVNNDNSTQEIDNPVNLTAYLNNSGWGHTFTVSCAYLDGGSTASLEYTVKVPRRAAQPTIASTSQPDSAGGKGKITFQDAGHYDIRNLDDTGASWMDVNVSGDLSVSVEPGRYQVRTHYYHNRYFASQPVEVAVKPFNAPSEDVRYKVVLNTNGGTVNSGAISDYVAGVGAQLPTDVTRSGYTFAGWFTDPDFADGTQVNAIAMSDSGDKEFWAKWVSSSTQINFVKVFGATAQTDGAGYSVTIPTKSESAAVLERNTEVSLAPGATYEWRILSGWESVVVVAHVTIGVTAEDGVTTKDYPLKVYFSDQGTEKPDPADTFTISYECNGGAIQSGAVNSYTAGQATTLPTDVVRDDFTFMGWYDNAQFAGSPVQGLDTSATGDKTFYAKWLSCKTGFASVKVDGQMGSFYDCAASVTLPVGSTLPTDPSKIEVTLVDGATAGELTTDDGGATWRFECTAEDGITKRDCQITVTIAKTQDEMDMADVMAAVSLIFDEVTRMKSSPELQAVSSQEDLEKWIDDCVAGLDLPADVKVERKVVKFVPAVGGTSSNPQGVNGYYKYTIVASKGNSSGSLDGRSADEAGAGGSGVQGLADGVHPASLFVTAAPSVAGIGDDEGGTDATSEDDADDESTDADNDVLDADAGIVVLAGSDDLPVTTAADLEVAENPKMIVVEGSLQATPYGSDGSQPPLRNVVNAKGDPNANLPKTGDGAGIEFATALLLIAVLAACGAACAFRRRAR